MYIPAAFREDRTEVMLDLMAGCSVATVVTNSSDGLCASHVPVEVDPTAGEFGTVRFHLARANEQHKVLLAGGEALLIFQGPLAYLTPSWYPSKKETGKVVPTLDYAAVHAYGQAREIVEVDDLKRHLSALTDHFEQPYAIPWALSDAPSDYIDRLTKFIVGIEVPVQRLEGKWKMSQNRPRLDRQGVALGYRAAGNDVMADLVEAYDPQSSEE